MFNSRYLFCIQPCFHRGEQGVLVVQVHLGQQSLNGHGSHFFTACRVIIKYNQGQWGKEQAAVLQQQFLNNNKQNKKQNLKMTYGY